MIEYLSAKVIEDVVVGLSVTKTHNGGYQVLYVIQGASVGEARMSFYGRVLRRRCLYVTILQR